MRGAGALLLSLALCLPAFADAPETSLVPQQRPGASVPAEAPEQPPAVTPQAPTATTVMIRAGQWAPRRSLRPGMRPGGVRATAMPGAGPSSVDASAAQTVTIIQRGGLFGMGQRVLEVRHFAGATAQAVPLSLRPEARPANLAQMTRAAATRTTPSRVTQPGRRGALCGRPGIIGEQLDRIPGRIQGCGIAEPVRIREIDGITLSQPATVNCETARALQDWLSTGAVPAVAGTGGGLSSIRVVASYACRTRNSRPGARLSEHATGNAIDIAGFGLVSGQELSVLNDWGDRRAGPILQTLHRRACGPFGTVLGPESDRFHRDHFHFDVARHRSGTYCR